MPAAADIREWRGHEVADAEDRKIGERELRVTVDLAGLRIIDASGAAAPVVGGTGPGVPGGCCRPREGARCCRS